MTVKQLKQALANLGPETDIMEIEIWLPGSRIYLAAPDGGPATPFMSDGKVLIEGNVRANDIWK